MMIFKELAPVTLTAPFRCHDGSPLPSGATGTVLLVFDADNLLVEFADAEVPQTVPAAILRAAPSIEFGHTDLLLNIGDEEDPSH